MKYLLDSDAVSILYDDKRESYDIIHSKISKLRDKDGLFTSMLILYELEYSFFNASDDKKISIRNTINSVLNDFDGILSLEEKGAAVFGELKMLFKKRKNFSRKEMRKHNIDIMLASTAISLSCILIGADKIYQDIAELNPMFFFDNWLA